MPYAGTANNLLELGTTVSIEARFHFFLSKKKKKKVIITLQESCIKLNSFNCINFAQPKKSRAGGCASCKDKANSVAKLSGIKHVRVITDPQNAMDDILSFIAAN